MDFGSYVNNNMYILQTLSHLTYEEDRIHGITKSVFQRYLFPNYPDLGDKLFDFLHYTANVNTSHLSANAFKQQAEKFLSVMNDQTVLENYVRMYSSLKGDGSINPDGLKALLNISYKIAMDNSGTPSCIFADQIINAVVLSCVSVLISLSMFHVSFICIL